MGSGKPNTESSDVKYIWNRDEDYRRGLSDGDHKGIDSGTGANKRGATTVGGFHHVALICRNMKQTVKFYEEGLGMKLRAIYPMHGVPGAKHCFLEAGNGNEISFVEFPEPREGVPGVSFSVATDTDCPVGTHHHMAYKADSLPQLYKLREQLKTAGSRVSKVIDHGFIHSFYFEDPNGFHLEVTCTLRPYTAAEYQPELLDKKVDMTHYEWDEKAMVDSAKEYADKVMKNKSTPQAKL